MPPAQDEIQDALKVARIIRHGQEIIGHIGVADVEGPDVEAQVGLVEGIVVRLAINIIWHLCTEAQGLFFSV